jgi:hypothetical protein
MRRHEDMADEKMRLRWVGLGDLGGAMAKRDR